MTFGPLESMAYALARGAVRAYLDVLEERSHALKETPDASDPNPDRIADAIATERMRQYEPTDHTGQKPSTPGGM